MADSKTVRKRRTPNDAWARQQMLANIQGMEKNKKAIRRKALAMFTADLDKKLENLQQGQGLGIVFNIQVIDEDRNSPEYAAWRTAVYQRDNYQCRECGSGGELQAHHILSWADYPELRLAINNGLTLCVGCHAKKHPDLPIVAKSKTRK